MVFALLHLFSGLTSRIPFVKPSGDVYSVGWKTRLVGSSLIFDSKHHFMLTVAVDRLAQASLNSALLT